MTYSKPNRKSRGRPRGFEEDAALDQAMLAFWRNGYQNTSLDDLVHATRASRASLYRVFGDKRAIFEKALARYGKSFSTRVTQALDSEKTGRERLADLMSVSADRLTSSKTPPGCLRCTSTLEMKGIDTSLDRVLRKANALFQKNIETLIKRAIDDGEIPGDRLKPLALFYTGVFNGMVTLAQSGASRSDLNEVIAVSLTAWPD